MSNPLKWFLTSMEVAESAATVEGWLRQLSCDERHSLALCLTEATRVVTEYDKVSHTYRSAFCNACTGDKNGKYPYSECGSCNKYPRLLLANPEVRS